ncbi:hypothetical protein CAP36_06605 [Chitinophagaceae bacterium IBVUCB2]|nr:hypothetical protein CAP36_06605 [Chitinophagaceae bacterium IBVUCB2]
MSNGTSIHFRGLNGIRALAAFSVIATHIIQSFSLFNLQQVQLLETGNYGVTMFFTLSGFLITYLLLQEKQNFGRVNIRKFYLRRILRIWPLYYLYLLMAVIVFFFYDEQLLNSYFIYYIFLLANIPFIYGAHNLVTGHYWSLGVEEQFYLFWPWVIGKVNKLIVWVSTFIIVFLVVKFIFWQIFKETGNPIYYNMIHITRFHCMAIGALGAILLFRKNIFFLKCSTHCITQLILWVIIVMIAVNKFRIAVAVDQEIFSVVSILLIINVALNPKSFLKLDNAILNYLGKISYGLYIYHPLVIFFFAKLFNAEMNGLSERSRIFTLFGSIFILTIAISTFSYFFFEKFFLKLKERVASIHAPTSKSYIYKQ